MGPVSDSRANTIGVLSALGAAACFSINDTAIKFLSGDYALHQIVLIRSTIGMVILLALIFPMQGGARNFKTRRLPMHVLRALFVVAANFFFFLALAAMPLADAAAIFFVSPLFVTVLSVVILGEHVGPRRWVAVGVGLIGVIIVMRPGSDAFQMASWLPVGAALGYALLHISTRWIGATESPATMTFYIQAVFIVVTACIGLGIGDGGFAGQSDPSLEFLLRAWVVPNPGDTLIFILIGAASTGGGYLISQAYRNCEAGLAAPFEYVALPLAIFWGVVVFGDWPDAISWVGIGLIATGGLYMFWRETQSAGGSLSSGPYRK